MGFLNDFITARAIDRSPAYARKKEAEQQYAMAQQYAQQQAQWLQQNRESFLGQQAQPEQLGLPSGNPALQGSPAQAGTGAYAPNIDPMQRHIMENNYNMMASGLPQVAVMGADMMKDTRGKIMTGITQLNMERWKKTNKVDQKSKYSNLDVDSQGRVWGLNGEMDQYEMVPGAAGTSFKDAQNDPAAVAEWRYFNSLTPQQKQEYSALKRSGQNIDLGGTVMRVSPTGQTIETIDKTLAPDQELGYKGDVVHAQGQATTIQDKLNSYPTASVAAESYVQDIDDTVSMLSDLKDRTSGATTGFGAWLQNMPATEAKRWRELAGTVQARLAMDKMSELKSLSPTGSTGFGALNEKELKLMTSYLGSLESSQSPEALRENIDKIIDLLTGKSEIAKKGIREADRWYQLNQPIYQPAMSYPQPGSRQPAGGGHSVNWSDL